MTKPDRIDNPARYDDIRTALEGTDDQLGHGYYVVKQPDQVALDRAITHAEARAQEMAFFEQTAPWATELAACRERFGTVHLQGALSSKLVGLSLQVLPEARAKISSMITDVDSTLAMIPPPPTRDVTGVVHDALRNLAESIRQEMLRVKTANTWRLIWDKLRTQFSERLQSLRPMLQTEGIKDRTSFRSGNSVETIDLVSDDEDTSPAPSSTLVTPMKRKEPAGSASATPGSRISKKAKVDDAAIRYQLDETRERLYQMSSAKLARVVNPEAVATLMLEPIKQFEVIMDQFYSALERAMMDRINEIMVACLGQWRTNLLFQEARHTVKEFFKLHFRQQRTIDGPEVYADELAGPYFYDARYMEHHMTHFLQHFKEARLRKRKTIWKAMRQEELGRDLKPADVAELDKPHMQAALAKDPYSQEIEVIAQIRSYYELASIRFHDSICMRVESKLFRQLSENLLTELKEGLRLTDENGKL